jgi:hypothetical protein
MLKELLTNKDENGILFLSKTETVIILQKINSNPSMRRNP